MKAILLIMIGLSSLSMAAESPRFTKADGVVTDSRTTLEWQDNVLKQLQWTEAIDYCEGLSLNSQTDWRLPNKKELFSIVDYSTYHPAISSVFQNTRHYDYWSSTTYTSGASNNVWIVNFNRGYSSNRSKLDLHFVRCVRGGQ